MSFWTIDDQGVLRARLHIGQAKAWNSERRFVFMIAGTQGGKTSLGSLWLDREMQKRGPGDYLAVTANYDLFQLKMLPEMLRFFERGLGWRHLKSERALLSPDEETKIIMRSAHAEGGLESATAKAAWLDECGQPGFKLTAWEAILRRLALHEGRVFGTTTPYNLGWLKTHVFDRWVEGDPRYDVIQFSSLANPAFPRASYEFAKETMQEWRFRMFYDARFTTPASLIYGGWPGETNYIEPFRIPDDWQKMIGVDFGGVNTAAVKIAIDPDTDNIYIIDEYLNGFRSAEEHAKSWKSSGLADGARRWAGGAPSEGQWRLEFRQAGIPLAQPLIKEVEAGIDRVTGVLPRLFLFRGKADHTRDQLLSYSRKMDEEGTILEDIENKNDYHYLDALRYIIPFATGRGFLVGNR